MTRLEPGARLMKILSVFMAFSIFATPLAYAQTSNDSSSPAQPASEGKGALTFSDGPRGAADAGGLLSAGNPVAADSSGGEKSVSSGAEAAAEDGTALAQSSGGSASRKLDPAYRYVQEPPGSNKNAWSTVTGDGKIRRSFKLFAKEELIHNLSFRDTPVKEVIAELARRGNLNIILDKSVFGKITGDLHDVTLNEAMDSVLAAAGLQSRVLDSNTVVIGSPNSLSVLGLNRTHYKVYKMSYANAFDMAQVLASSVFNRGFLPDFTTTVKTRSAEASAQNPKTATEVREESQAAGLGEGGAAKKKDTREQQTNSLETKEESDIGGDYSFSSRLDTQKTLKNTTRIQTQEGTGFNNAAQDPGTEQVRAFQEVTTDMTVDQNGGGAIVIPDNRNRQLIVVGTPDDLAVADECIRLLDRRPKQIHVQVSVVELTNTGIRQLGASLNLQGQGASGALLGGSGAPLINLLPGMGSTGNQRVFTSAGTVSTNNNVQLLPPGAPNPLLGSFTSSLASTQPALNTALAPSTDYTGILGGFFPASLARSIAGVTSTRAGESRFNFLALSKAAGGRTNISTVPMGLNFSLNLVLEQQKAKILANPSVVVSDNTEALVTLATEVIHKVTSTVSLGVTNVNVELTKAGIFLEVMPKASEDGFIYMRIRPQVSAPVGPPQTFANQQVIVTLLNIREIIAQEVRVKDGQTLVLGGLFTENEAAQISKVPYLAETPLFGALFRNTLKGRSRTELMLMITPKIVEEQPSAPPIAESSPGSSM